MTRSSGERWIAITLCFGALACQGSEAVCRAEAPLVEVVLYSKDELQGRWEHTATLVDAGETAAVAGATTEPLEIEWLFYEDLLVATEGVEPVEPIVALAVDGHYTRGSFSNGDRCIVVDERPWYERSHARIDWWMDHAASSRALPVELEAGRVEPWAVFIDSIDPEDLWPRFERDFDERLVGVRIRVAYWVECTGCEPSVVEVVHSFRRLGF